MEPESLYDIEDPLELFQKSTQAILKLQEAIDQLASIRSRAVAALYASGRSYKELATELGLSAPRVGQIVSSNDDLSMSFMRAWFQIEMRLEDVAALAADFGIKLPKRPLPGYAAGMQVLRASDSFDRSAWKSLDQLRDVRNRFVHGRLEITPELAHDVLRKADFVNAHIVLWMQRHIEASIAAQSTPLEQGELDEG